MSRTLSREDALNRREFLGSSALNAAGMAVGAVGLAGVAAAGSSPVERVSIGVIGIRNQGKTLATELAGFADVQIAAVCDVDESLFAGVIPAIETRQGSSPRTETDFRGLLDDPTIDAVVIAAPDHWHAVMTSLACRAGKDVYLETPVTHALGEGDELLATVRASGRIVQPGMQQRSGEQFRSAVEYVRSGRLGEVHLAKTWTVHQRKTIGRKADGPVPAGVNYDLWLGPASERAFNPNRFHHNWQWFWEYGSGELGNWGVHLLDVARWGLGVAFPQQVAATGGRHHFQDDRQTPDTLHVNFAFPAKTITWEHRLWSSHGQEGRSAAVAFYGDRGTLIVDRGGWKVYGQKESLTVGPAELTAAHLRAFLDSVKTRRAPICDLETGLVSSALCHLGNLAYRLGRSVNVDSATGTIQHDPAAVALAQGEHRSPWNLLVS